jgi:hypothetical protein
VVTRYIRPLEYIRVFLFGGVKVKVKGFRYVGSTILGYKLVAPEISGKNAITGDNKGIKQNKDSYNTYKKVKRMSYNNK